MAQSSAPVMSDKRANFCSICSVTCHNEDAYNKHLGGKKHETMLARLESSHKRDEKTIYVTGDRAGFVKLSELALSDYFSTIGRVSRVKFLKERGFAFVEFANKSYVDQALSQPNHVIKLGKFSCKISVRLCRQSTPEQLHRADVAHRKRVADKEEQFQNLKSASLGDQYDEKLAEQLEADCHDLTSQLTILASEVGITDKSIETANQVARRIQTLVNSPDSESQLVDGCRAAIFGSKVSTLGLRSSDLDVVLLFNVEDILPKHLIEVYCVGGKESTGEQLPGIVPAKQKRLISCLVKQGHAPAKLQGKKTTQIAKILGCCPEFSCILKIAARIPIVRCLHNPTSTQVDISTDSLLSVNNSHLLKLYSLYDYRIRPLVLGIRYWAKIQGICPDRNSFTSYALTWLVLFFLQTRSPPVCPTVAQLASLSQRTEPEIILSTWNASYPLDLTKWPMTQNTESLNELFPSFFEFYANFSFSETAIILRDSSTVPVQSLISAAEAHEPSAKDAPSDVKVESCCCNDRENDDNEDESDQADQTEIFRASLINVQDPIQLTRNITGSISRRMMEAIVATFKGAAEIVERNKGSDNKTLLRQLLKKQESQAVAKEASKHQNRQRARKSGKSLVVALSPDNNVIHSRSLFWFRKIHLPGTTLGSLCSIVSAIGALSLLHDALLFDIVIDVNTIAHEIWRVVNPGLAAQLGIVSQEARASSPESDSFPMFVPPTLQKASSNSKETTSKQSADSSKPTDNNTLISATCTARFLTWTQREEMATAMRRRGQCPVGPEGGFEPLAKDYGLALEKQISKSIAFDPYQGVAPLDPPISFTVALSSCPSSAGNKADDVRLTMTTTAARPPPNFYSAVGAFVSKWFIEAVNVM